MRRRHLFLTLVATMLLCTTMPTLAQEKIQLRNKVDSVSYAIGVSQSQGFLPYLRDELKVNLNYVDDFAKGIRQISVSNLSGDRKVAYIAGKEIRALLEGKIPAINQIVFGENSTRTISPDLYFEGFLSIITGKGALMTYDKGAEVVNRLCQELKTETTTNTPTTSNSDVLANLTFESSQKYVLVKKDGISLRTKANAKAPFVKAGSGQYEYNIVPSTWDLMAVLDETQAFYKVRVQEWGGVDHEGWIKKADVKLCNNKTITAEMMNTNQAGDFEDMDIYSMYRVYAPIGTNELAVGHTFTSGVEYLRLGKLINNVFVFKYAVPILIYIDEENPNKFDVSKELRDGEMLMTLNVGTKYCVRLTPGIKNQVTGKYDTQPWALDLSKLNDKVLRYFFTDVIQKNKTSYFYLNAELLSGKYANFFM